MVFRVKFPAQPISVPSGEGSYASTNKISSLCINEQNKAVGVLIKVCNFNFLSGSGDHDPKELLSLMICGQC